MEVIHVTAMTTIQIHQNVYAQKMIVTLTEKEIEIEIEKETETGKEIEKEIEEVEKGKEIEIEIEIKLEVLKTAAFLHLHHLHHHLLHLHLVIQLLQHVNLLSQQKDLHNLRHTHQQYLLLLLHLFLHILFLKIIHHMKLDTI